MERMFGKMNPWGSRSKIKKKDQGLRFKIMAKKGSLNDHHSFLLDGFEPFPFGKDVSAQEICATDITKCFESNIQFHRALWRSVPLSSGRHFWYCWWRLSGDIIIVLIAWSIGRGYITSGKLFMTQKNKESLKKHTCVYMMMGLWWFAFPSFLSLFLLLTFFTLMISVVGWGTWGR